MSYKMILYDSNCYHNTHWVSVIFVWTAYRPSLVTFRRVEYQLNASTNIFRFRINSVKTIQITIMFISQSGSVRILFVTQSIFSSVSFIVIIPHIFFNSQPFDVTVSLWFFIRWSFKTFIFLYPRLQTGHKNCFPPLCSFSCSVKWDSATNCASHTLQMNRFLSVSFFESLRGQQYRFSPVDL